MVLVAALLAGVVVSSCAVRAVPALPGVVKVVAAESFWGSIAAQVGGPHVQVTSIITNPNADPHSYEPTPADGRALSDAALVIDNGVGYDPWVHQLLGAAGGHRLVLTVASAVGAGPGANPHLWYDPRDVGAMISAYASDLSRIDPANQRDFAARADKYEHGSLAPYHGLIDAIASRYRGTPVGASESIFAMLAPALGLALITPPGAMRAVSEGSELTAADKSTIDRQIQNHLIKIFVYNRQNTTPDVTAQLAACRKAGIPTAVITETLAPPSASYQAWQTAQLEDIAAALAEATGR